MAKEKKLTGRPRRNPDEVLGQLTIRLSSKLKFGLELLARAQHRSLSQAVEWALQAGLARKVAKTGRQGSGLVMDGTGICVGEAGGMAAHIRAVRIRPFPGDV
ncbi:MAG: ribbon-helix-helix protein, CopG family [Rhodanobacteraceae bacterium]|nr:ribbon-helix-helix protein, CopG family [Rhodanobacteraceae bacterium]